MTNADSKATPSSPSTPFQPVEGKSFYTSPTSPASNLIMETLGAGENLAELPARKRQIKSSSELKVLVSGQGRRVLLTRPNGDEITLELSDINKLLGSKNPARKFFRLALIKANEQAVHDGQLTQDYISFPLKELVDLGLYKSIESARLGFRAGMNTLTSLKLSGKICRGKKKETIIEGTEVLFSGARIKNNQCFLRLNYGLSWDALIQYYTILPAYYFRLPSRASDLLDYISTLARQRTKDIEEKGYFTIGFRAIQCRLQLPNEIGNRNPDRTIKQPIEEAVKQIEDAQRERGKVELSFLFVYDASATIADYLDNGFLKVIPEGEYRAFFVGISQKNAKQIETAQKQKARIVEKAKTINLAKKMEEEAATDLPDA